MEQHPVPQNVTTFQFRLVGDMTIRQFGYLAGGAIVAYLCYKLPLPLLLNWAFAIVGALGGFGLAFVPIEERPMDVWILSFFKSIYSPTVYTWQKQSPVAQHQPKADQPLAGATDREDVLQTIFRPQTQSAPYIHSAALIKNKRQGVFDWLFNLLQPRPKADQPLAEKPQLPFAPATQTTFPSTFTAKMNFAPPPTVRSRNDMITETAKKEADAQSKLVTIQRELGGKTLVQSRVLELQKQLADLVRDRDSMEEEIARLRRAAAAAPRPKPAGTYVATPAARSGPSVRIVTADRAVKAGLPRLTAFANVVTGIVKDGDQNLLPGVLVTVKDKEGVPVRALKTNRLGQFAASTPLTNGTYVLEIEDPRLRYTFDRAQITLNGSIVPTLEIFAKGQKEITRAKLEKELFGNKPS